MPKGKQWTEEEERKLRELANSGVDFDVMGHELNRTSGAIREKCRGLGLEVVVKNPSVQTTTTTALQLPDELLSPEEALKIIAAALKEAAGAGLTKTELYRLNVLATLHKTYNEGLENYVRYREIERELMELKKQLGFEKKSKSL